MRPAPHLPSPPPSGCRAVDVLVFAALAEALGTERVTVELPVGATAGDVLERVMCDPRAASLRGRVRVAVGQRFAGRDEPLALDDEIALIPPVAGG